MLGTCYDKARQRHGKIHPLLRSGWRLVRRCKQRPTPTMERLGSRRDDQGPFGNHRPEVNLVGLLAVKFNLRFPGQYRDAETGLFYNYFRDYDPQTGRYVQSDPIGLAGGLNTFAYVGSNPLRRVDPMGLAGTFVLPRPLTIPRPGIAPRPRPYDPAIPFVPDGDRWQLPGSRFCKRLVGITHGPGADGGYDLTCWYECADGTGFSIRLDGWNAPNCPDYWIDDTVQGPDTMCRRP